MEHIYIQLYQYVCAEAMENISLGKYLFFIEILFNFNALNSVGNI